MKYAIKLSRDMHRTVEALKRSGNARLIASIAEVGDLLAVSNAPAQFILREQWRDHALRGTLKGIRELHLAQDDLLMYTIDEKHSIIEFLDIVTHEELRKWKR